MWERSAPARIYGSVKRIVGFLALLTVGAAGCEHWDTIIRPAVDTTPPVAAVRLLEIGGEQVDRMSVTSSPLQLVTDDSSRLFLAIAAAWDPQGAYRVKMYHGLSRTCVNGDIGASQVFELAPFEEIQPGEPGDEVETGVWTGHTLDLSDWLACPAGTELVSANYWWTAEAENYAGQVTNNASGSVRLEP